MVVDRSGFRASYDKEISLSHVTCWFLWQGPIRSPENWCWLAYIALQGSLFGEHHFRKWYCPLKRGHYHMSHVCNYGTDQSDRRMNVARFCDHTCTLELWTGTCFASTESTDSIHVRLQISALGRIFAISHGWKFLSFFRAKELSFRVLFFELYLFESSIGSMIINTISPGSRGSLAAFRPATAALGPADLGLPWRAEI